MSLLESEHWQVIDRVTKQTKFLRAFQSSQEVGEMSHPDVNHNMIFKCNTQYYGGMQIALALEPADALHHPDHVNKDAGPCGDVHALHHPFHTWYWQSSQKFLVGGSCMFILCGPTWLAWGLFAGIMDLYTGVSTGSITHSAIHLAVGKSYCLKCASLDGVAHRWSRLIQIIPIFWSHLAPYSWAAANLVCSQVLSSNFASFAPPSSASLAASANRWGWRCLGRWQRILACVFFWICTACNRKSNTIWGKQNIDIMCVNLHRSPELPVVFPLRFVTRKVGIFILDIIKCIF